MEFRDILAEDRRLVILRLLAESAPTPLNESVLRKSINAIGNPATRDLVRADIAFLEQHRLVRSEVLHPQSGDLILVHLLTDGEEVASGLRRHPGVARRGLD